MIHTRPIHPAATSLSLPRHSPIALVLFAAFVFEVLFLHTSILSAQPAPLGPPRPRDSTNSSRLLGSKRFTFDAAFLSDPPGLRFSFSRPVPTFDLSKGDTLDPVFVPPNSPRYERTTALAGAPRFESVRDTPDASTQILASGLDHDGVTPLLVLLQDPIDSESPVLLDVFSVAGAQLLALEAAGSGPGRVRTLLPPSGDLLRGSIPNKVFRPVAGAISHGLIVLFCTVSHQAAPTDPFLDAASAFVTSQDRGLTWTLSYESPPFFPGTRRGAPWAMQNWWPTKRHVPPTQAFFAASDYCLNPGSPGGNSFLFRASRPKPGFPWVIEPARIIYQSLGTDHHHIAGVLPFHPTGGSGNGLRFFSVLGDSRANNRIVSLTRPDSNYLDPNNWSLQDNFHGSAAAGPFPGAEANQFVGCAPGPHDHSVLAGADLITEQLMLLHFDDAAPSHPRTTRLFGLITTQGDGNLNFIIRTPTPELGGPYCATHAIATPTPAPPLSSRTLFSHDGIHWAHAAANGGGYPAIHGDHLYFDGPIATGVTRSPVPTLRIARPLLVGPGGWQRLRDNPRAVSGNGRIVPLARDPAGRWIDNGVPISPQPPAFGPVYKVSTLLEPTATLGFLYPASTGSAFAPRLWPQVQARWWILNPDPSRAASITVGLGFSPQPPDTYRESLLASVGSWAPVDLTFFSVPRPGSEPYLLFRQGYTTSDPQTFYIAMDCYAEGRGYPGYPMPPDAAPIPAPPTHAGTPAPDELASITGFACSPDWTITLAAQFPENGTDFTMPEQTRWSIATLWADPQNFIELAADMTSGHLVVEVTAAGLRSSTLTSDPLVFTRGSPILVSLAHRGSDGRLELTLSAAAQSLNSHSITPAPNARLRSMPREVRFYQPSVPPTSAGIAARVTPLQIWGGRIDERAFLPEPARAELLQTLDFLAPKE